MFAAHMEICCTQLCAPALILDLFGGKEGRWRGWKVREREPKGEIGRPCGVCQGVEELNEVEVRRNYI